MSKQHISNSELRSFLTRYLEGVRINKDPVIVKFFNEDAVAMIPVEEYNRLLDVDHEVQLAKICRGEK